MQGIAQKILAAPERYSVDMLRRAVETGLLPAYIGIPLIQAKMQSQQQVQQSASLGQPSPDQQPTVAEQVMGQGGVDSLPTNLPQEYAAGGIVAFDGGGKVERFQNQGLVGEFDTGLAPPIEAPRRPTNTEVDAIAEALRAQGRNLDIGTMRDIQAGRIRMPISQATAPAVVPTPAPAAAPAPRAQGPSGSPRTAVPAPGIAAQPLVAPPELAAPKGPTARQQAEEIYGALGKQTEAVGRDFDERIRAARGLMQGEAFEGYKKQLEDEARRSGADRADAKNMALFKAGLAMMAGTSRHALENIGKGAMVGVEDFQTAARELRKADKDRQKELALIDQARRAEKAGNIKEEVQLLSAARDRGISALEKTAQGIAAGTNMDIDSARQLAAARYKGAVDIFTTGQQTESAERRTAMSNDAQITAARIGAAATLGASQNRARDPNAITPGVQTAMYQQRIALQEPARAFALKQLGFKTEPPIPGPNAGPLDPAVLNYTRYRDLMERYIESNIPAPPGRAAPPASSVAPAASNQFPGYERLR